jgi:peptidoglycan hydrolase-like protein with peptidoglycan-binding domain
MRVQLTLNAFGFYEGEADGIMGKQTRKALNDFRASVHLKQHDKLDVETLNALGILVK